MAVEPTSRLKSANNNSLIKILSIYRPKKCDGMYVPGAYEQ